MTMFLDLLCRRFLPVLTLLVLLVGLVFQVLTMEALAMDPVLLADSGAMPVPNDTLPAPAPGTIEDVIERGRAAWDTWRTMGTLAGLGMAIWVLLSALRLPALGGLYSRVPRSWRIAGPLALGALASVLMAAGGLVPPDIAVILALAGPLASQGHEVLETVRGNRPA